MFFGLSKAKLLMGLWPKLTKWVWWLMWVPWPASFHVIRSLPIWNSILMPIRLAIRQRMKIWSFNKVVKTWTSVFWKWRFYGSLKYFQDDEIRLKIVGTRVDANEIFSIGSLMDDYLGLVNWFSCLSNCQLYCHKLSK